MWQTVNLWIVAPAVIVLVFAMFGPWLWSDYCLYQEWTKRVFWSVLWLGVAVWVSVIAGLVVYTTSVPKNNTDMLATTLSAEYGREWANREVTSIVSGTTLEGIILRSPAGSQTCDVFTGEGPDTMSVFCADAQELVPLPREEG